MDVTHVTISRPIKFEWILIVNRAVHELFWFLLVQARVCRPFREIEEREEKKKKLLNRVRYPMSSLSLSLFSFYIFRNEVENIQ